MLRRRIKILKFHLMLLAPASAGASVVRYGVSIDRLVRRQGAIWRSDNGIFNASLEGADGEYPREFENQQ